VRVTVFLGAPGSGKGTQAKRLSEKQGFQHLSTGDMLRSAIQAGNDLGKRAKVFIEKGELVPDDVMIGLIESKLASLPVSSRVILDGFPRTGPQSAALDLKPSTSVDLAVYFIVPRDILIGRLTGRRICEKCGESFHVIFMPPKADGICDKCGGKLIQRPDDAESVVVRRLEVFNQQNQQLLDYYRTRNRLREVNADSPVDNVQRELAQLLL
jgi:adenylate kinase